MNREIENLRKGLMTMIKKEFTLTKTLFELHNIEKNTEIKENLYEKVRQNLDFLEEILELFNKHQVEKFINTKF